MPLDVTGLKPFRRGLREASWGYTGDIQPDATPPTQPSDLLRDDPAIEIKRDLPNDRNTYDPDGVTRDLEEIRRGNLPYLKDT